MSTLRTKNKRTRAIRAPQQTLLPLPIYPTSRTVQYFGMVNYATTERVIEEITLLMQDDPYTDIYLSVTSAGGPTGTAMSFYDHMRLVLKAPLVTIGSGDVDSSGIIVFLSGEKRYITLNTTLLLHRAGRVFEGDKRVTASELEAMSREDHLKDLQYASILADRSRGRLSTEAVYKLMDANTILTPSEMVALGLADGVIT